MTKYTKEQLLEKYRQLPESVKDAIFSVDTAEIIKEVGEKRKLMIDKIGELADETGLVMLGFTHPRDFIPHLADRLEISREIAKEIGEEINSKIFFPIRENIKKIHGMEAAPEGGEPRPESFGREPAPITESKKDGESSVLSQTKPFPTETVVLESTISKRPEAQSVPMTAQTLKEAGLPALPTGQAGGAAGAPTSDAPTVSVGGIFEAKTKEGIFRQPMETVEKETPSGGVGIDPYRESIL